MVNIMDHPSSQAVWRYMDFPKYMSIVVRRSLWFARADTFEDKWEGFSRCKPLKLSATPDAAMQDYAEDARQHVRWLNRLPRQFFISCWTTAEESIGKWKVYTSGQHGIAIQSTTARVSSFVQQARSGPLSNWRAGNVHYEPESTFDDGDYGTSVDFDRSKAFDVFFRKRACFTEEGEWRAVIADKSTKGSAVPITFDGLIEQIVVSPLASRSFVDDVNAFGKAFGVPSLAFRSQLGRAPRREQPVMRTRHHEECE
jgi:hypothetical protein